MIMEIKCAYTVSIKEKNQNNYEYSIRNAYISFLSLKVINCFY